MAYEYRRVSKNHLDDLGGVGFPLLNLFLGFAVFGLEEMCVRNDTQREGIGTRLLFNLERKSKEMGLNHIYLATTKGTPADYFYAKCGYQTNERMILMTHRL